MMPASPDSSTAATRDQAATDGVSVLEVCSAADSSENLATKPDSGGRPVISRAQATKDMPRKARAAGMATPTTSRSEEHTSELQSLMRISYAVFCLKKKTTQ